MGTSCVCVVDFGEEGRSPADVIFDPLFAGKVEHFNVQTSCSPFFLKRFVDVPGPPALCDAKRTLEARPTTS